VTLFIGLTVDTLPVSLAAKSTVCGKNSSGRLERFFLGGIEGCTAEWGYCITPGAQLRDTKKMNEMSNPRPRRTDDGLGPTSDIGAKLRALYGAVQDEGIPESLLDLLEKLDRAEQKADPAGEGE